MSKAQHLKPRWLSVASVIQKNCFKKTVIPINVICSKDGEAVAWMGTSSLKTIYYPEGLNANGITSKCLSLVSAMQSQAATQNVNCVISTVVFSNGEGVILSWIYPTPRAVSPVRDNLSWIHSQRAE